LKGIQERLRRRPRYRIDVRDVQVALARILEVRMTVLHWVLNLSLPSTEKFVLLVLAMLGDDMGRCYPSQAYVSRATGRTLKTVRGALAGLKERQLVVTMPRRTNSRGYTSNMYVVMVPPEVARGSSSGSGVRAQEKPSARDGVTTGQLQQTDIRYSYKKDNRSPDQFVFANEISDEDRQQILRALPNDRVVAQQILDEVAARMASGGVRSPVRYALGLIQRHRAGGFVPDKGLRVAGNRLVDEAAGANQGAVDRSSELANAIAGLADAKVVQLRPSTKKQKA
jgi:hypothetical protein